MNGQKDSSNNKTMDRSKLELDFLRWEKAYKFKEGSIFYLISLSLISPIVILLMIAIELQFFMAFLIIILVIGLYSIGIHYFLKYKKMETRYRSSARLYEKYIMREKSQKLEQKLERESRELEQKMRKEMEKVTRILLESSKKFDRLELLEIQELSKVKDKSLLLQILKQMLADGTIAGTYFESTQTLAFDQSVNQQIHHNLTDILDNLDQAFQTWTLSSHQMKKE